MHHTFKVIYLICTDGVHMSDNQTAACEEEEPSSQQAMAKRMRHMCTADPNPQTHIDPVTGAHAMHAEPRDSTSQNPPPGAAAAAARYVLAAHTSAMHCCCIKQLYGPDLVVARKAI